MSRFIATAAAAAMLMTTAHAAPFIGSSGWTTSDDMSGTSGSVERTTLIEGFLTLIGFDEKFKAAAAFGPTPPASLSEGAHGEVDSCEDEKTIDGADESAEGADEEQAGPEPILFAF